MRVRHAQRVVAVFVGALPLLGACAPSLFERESQMAKQAELRDDAAGALDHWARACRAEPTNQPACQNEQAWAGKLRARSVAAAKTPCDSGDVDLCVATLRDLARLRPGDPSAAEMMRTGALRRRQQCVEKETVGHLDSTMDRVLCMNKNAPAFVEAGQRDALLEERRHAAAQLVAAATGAPAASYVLLRTARCLAPEIEAGRASTVARAFLAEASLPVVVTAESTSGREIPKNVLANLCYLTAKEIGESIHCSDSTAGISPDLTIRASLTLGRVAHSKSPEQLVAKYVSGTERVVNPDRAPAERALDRAKRSFDAIELEARDRQTRCQTSKMRDACDGYNAIQSTYNARQDEYLKAKRQLADTPAYFDRDVVETVPYTVWHHLFSVPYTVATSSGAGEQANAHGVFRRESAEQPGIAPAGVRAIPLVMPTDEDFDAEVLREASHAASALLRRAIASRAVCMDKPWSFDGPDLGCRATAQLYVTGHLPDTNAIFPSLACASK